MRARAILLALLLAPLAGPAPARTNCPAIELLYDEFEQLSEKRTDTNEDCRPDEFVYYREGKAERAERDQDFDGRIDVWLYFGPDGQPLRQEQDTTGDGKADRWITHHGGRPRTQLDDRNADGKPDATLHYQGELP